MIHLKSVFLRFVLPPVVCCGAIAFAQNTLDSKANEPISSAPVASGSVLTPAPVLAPTPVVPAEIATPVPVAPEIIDEEPQDYSLADESELFDDEAYDPDSDAAQKLKNDLREPSVLDETILYFDEESRSVYKKTQDQLRMCSKLPVSFIWKNFSPFFNYKKDSKFVEFASLLMAIWRAESNFSKPNNGVIIQPNCRNKKSKVVASLAGRSLKKDLRVAEKKEKKIQKSFSKCKITRADYGPLQWNNHWRLSQKMYRKEIERALLLTTQYSKENLRKLKMSDINMLVKYNSHALYVLGALSFKDNLHRPKQLVRNYNPNRAYQEKVLRWRSQYVTLLNSSDQCSLTSTNR